jgi:hypothetical protein
MMETVQLPKKGLLAGMPLARRPKCPKETVMKKLLVLPIAAVVAFAACSEQEPFGPERPQFELVDGTQIRVTGANIDVIATFKVDVEGGVVYLGTETGVPGFDSDGNPHGACFTGGRWQNPSNKKFAARVPHNHCTVVGVERQVGLESITAAHWTQDHGTGTGLRTSFKLALNEAGSLFVEWNAAPGQEKNRVMLAEGTVVAHGIGDDGMRYGTFTFDLADFAAEPTNVNLFGEYEAQTEDGGLTVFGLSRSITATFTHPNGVTETVDGTLYWTER